MSVPTVLLSVALFAGRAGAHGGSLGGAGRQSIAVPTWLFLVTGGALVGASFLLASFVTDRSFVRAIEEWRRPVPLPTAGPPLVLARLVGIAGLVAVVVAGLLGPADPLANIAVLLVWVGWWAGFAMSAYAVGNAWPAVNPWRTIARHLPSRGLAYPERLGAWPGVVGLLVIVWVEVVSPIADDARLLVAVVLAYTLATLAGAVAFGPGTWFERVDPVSRVFRWYGRVAPVGRDEGRLRLRVPGSALSDADATAARGDVAFVIALLWGTTFDGLVATPTWATVVDPVVQSGVPPAIVYPLALVAGFVVFFGIYRLAARYARRTAGTFLATDALARLFAPPLLAIAAGYHLAHFLGYFLSLAPALLAAVTAPFSTPATVPLFHLPEWFGAIALAAVVAGHLLAIWAAHAVALDTFPGRLQAIRSQYPFVAAMILYTMTSLWVVSRPAVEPPFL